MKATDVDALEAFIALLPEDQPLDLEIKYKKLHPKRISTHPKTFHSVEEMLSFIRTNQKDIKKVRFGDS